MITSDPTNESTFVILQGLKEHNRFFTDFKIGDEPTKLLDRTIAYRVLGYAKDLQEAQAFLFGRSYTLSE